MPRCTGSPLAKQCKISERLPAHTEQAINPRKRQSCCHCRQKVSTAPGMIHRFLEETERQRASTKLCPHPHPVFQATKDSFIVLALVILVPSGGRRWESVRIFGTELEGSFGGAVGYTQCHSCDKRGATGHCQAGIHLDSEPWWVLRVEDVLPLCIILRAWRFRLRRI